MTDNVHILKSEDPIIAYHSYGKIKSTNLGIFLPSENRTKRKDKQVESYNHHHQFLPLDRIPINNNIRMCENR